jgi:hypothetical protein
VYEIFFTGTFLYDKSVAFGTVEELNFSCLHCNTIKNLGNEAKVHLFFTV